MRIRFPIRYKFLSVTTLLLVFSVVSYLFLASHIFRRDKIELVFDLNRSAVSGFASDMNTMFRGIADKMKLAAVLSQDGGRKSQLLLEDVLANDSNIVFLVASYGFKNVDQVIFDDSKFAQTYGVSQDYFKKTLVEQRGIPFDEIQSQGEAVWNLTLKDGPPLIGFGKSVVPEARGDANDDAVPAPFAMIAYVRADKILSSFTSSRLNDVTLVNQHGQVLVAGERESMLAAKSLAQHPLFKAANGGAVKTGVLSFKSEGHEVLGAHAASLSGKLLVLSQVDGRYAFSAVDRLVQRSLLFALIAITLAFLAAVFFSRSLTRPIQALVEAMKSVSRGEQTPTLDVGTRDEIALLASSFNTMIADLQDSREELERVNRDLEMKVKERTHQLEEQNIAVKKAQEALLQSTRLATVGEVAGRAAHEVLNPLTSIVNRVEKIRNRLQAGPTQEITLVRDIVASWEGDVNQGGLKQLLANWEAPSSIYPDQKLYDEDIGNLKQVEATIRGELTALTSDMDFVLKESHRINKIIQDMRGLTRIKGDLQVVSSRDLVHEAVKIMADLGQHHGVEFVENYVEGGDKVRVDADEFIQCATNLIRNSIQAIESRKRVDPSLKGQIKISVARDREGVAIEIGDNGAGISTEHQAKLFEIQFSTKSASEGTGLGLTISRRFIRAFGGDIELAHSAPNEGCTFRIRLPHANTQEEQRAVA